MSGPHHRRHAVFARHDGRMAHRAADIGHRRLDLAEHRPPARAGHRADEDVALAHLADLARGLEHPRNAFDDARRSGETGDHVLALLVDRRRPAFQAFAGDAPQHLHRGVFHRIGYGAERDRRIPVLEPFVDRAPPRQQRLEMPPALAIDARRPGQHRVDQRLFHLGVLKVKNVLRLLDHIRPHQQVAELAHLVVEGDDEPVLAEEFVVLDIGEHRVAEAEHLVEGGPVVVGRQKFAVVRHEALAFLLEPVDRPVEAFAPLHHRDIARQRRERNRQIVVPAALVVIEPVAARDVEPRLARRLERVEPLAPRPAHLCQ